MEKISVYAIYDKKANRYDTPFFAFNDLFAKRRFHMMATNNTENNVLKEFLKDFDLCQVGTFDVLTGEINPQQVTILEGIQIQKEE